MTGGCHHPSARPATTGHDYFAQTIAIASNPVLLALLVIGVVTDTVDTKRIMVPQTKVDHVEAKDVLRGDQQATTTRTTTRTAPSAVVDAPLGAVSNNADTFQKGVVDVFLVTGAATDTVDETGGNVVGGDVGKKGRGQSVLPLEQNSSGRASRRA